MPRRHVGHVGHVGHVARGQAGQAEAQHRGPSGATDPAEKIRRSEGMDFLYGIYLIYDWITND